MDEFLKRQLQISPATLKKLAKLELDNLMDLVCHKPLRYEADTEPKTIRQTSVGDKVLIEGTIVEKSILLKGRRQLVLQLQDVEGSKILIRLFHFYPNQLNDYTINQTIRAFGEIKHGYYGKEMIHPRIQVQFSRVISPYLTPIYPTVKGLSQRVLQGLIHRALTLTDLEDFLPDALLKKNELIDFKQAVYALHYTKHDLYQVELSGAIHPALKRLKFDELLAQQLSMGLLRLRRQSRKKVNLQLKQGLMERLLRELPFQLTQAQKRALREIEENLKAAEPMHRLLQGDVGSGKTIVAAAAALMVIEAGYQVALVAPTELLAEQHTNQFKTWLEPLGISVALLIGAQTKKEKTQIKEKLASGEHQIALGTHALFQKDIKFKNLQMIIIDEQHRFGVNQRLLLKEKGEGVDQLMMSATPIPRTLAMTYFADVDVSSLDELPPNRTPVRTILIEESRRAEVENFVWKKIQEGRQVYWVCPLIEESESLQLQTAISLYEKLVLQFPKVSIGLLHGRMKKQEKIKLMEKFKDQKLQILVATTVIEVGIDVPNASTMVIEHAERMGLSQLHQLRGRVGRAERLASEALLLYQTPLSDKAKARLKVIYQSNDGFQIANEDLRLRGPGEFLGAKQSGIPVLKFADITEDAGLLALARATAAELLRTSPEIVGKYIRRWLPDREAYFGV
ncbi:MAG: ATP-dependent DNA helicase RecG [Neisseriaceae bacterium]